MNTIFNKPVSVFRNAHFSCTVHETAFTHPIKFNELITPERDINQRSTKIDETAHRSSEQTLFLHQLVKVLDQNIAQATFTVEKLAESMCVCSRTLHRKTIGLTTLSPTKLIRWYRLIRAVDLLKQGYLVSDAANAVGFGNLSYFTKCFMKQFKMYPSDYQKQEEMLNSKNVLGNYIL